VRARQGGRRPPAAAAAHPCGVAEREPLEPPLASDTEGAITEKLDARGARQERARAGW